MKTIENIVKEIADIELGNKETSKELWLDLAHKLESGGVKKNHVSKTIVQMVDSQMKTKDKHAKFNNGWFYTIMKENGYTDREYHTKEILRKEGQKPVPKIHSTEDQKIVPKDYPEGDYIVVLEKLRTISSNNITNINRILSKLIFDPNRRVDEQCSYDERQAILEKQKAKIYKRRDVLKRKIKPDPQINKILREQKQIEFRLNERDRLTHWEKLMSLLAMHVGYDKHDIARILSINVKHMNINIIPQHKHILETLDWFKRCPVCGAKIAEFFEGLIKSNQTQLPNSRYDIEPLKLTTYQHENAKLKKENKKLRDEIAKNKKH